ncbi:MAG: flagellar hook capping protein [Firmicutes bacterium]|jgi:flagellar basal-body rod modification protein FlgD|nr:flagellar hook capping protein [Bacillota bacterium]
MAVTPTELMDLTKWINGTSGTSNGADTGSVRDKQKTSNSTLSFEDMLLLMVTQFQNQSIDDTASTTDMMNQMTQMTSVQAMTAMTESMTALAQSSTLTYASSLVGKDVTVGVFNEKGELSEIVGNVTATGILNGEAVIFIGDDCYSLNSVMAVGHLPETKTETDDTQTPGDSGEGEGGSATEPEEETTQV